MARDRSRQETRRPLSAALGRFGGRRGPLKCSFCGKPESEVEKLIAGPAVFICGECVAKCVAILREDAANGRRD
jgi:hypothetical protein